MGWLGWSPDVALAADVNLVQIALASRSDLLSVIFGSGKPKTDKAKNKQTIGSRFKAFRDRINGRQKREDG